MTKKPEPEEQQTPKKNLEPTSRERMNESVRQVMWPLASVVAIAASITAAAQALNIDILTSLPAAAGITGFATLLSSNIASNAVLQVLKREGKFSRQQLIQIQELLNDDEIIRATQEMSVGIDSSLREILRETSSGNDVILLHLKELGRLHKNALVATEKVYNEIASQSDVVRITLKNIERKQDLLHEEVRRGFEELPNRVNDLLGKTLHHPRTGLPDLSPLRVPEHLVKRSDIIEAIKKILVTSNLCIVGESGKGKSTLAAMIAADRESQSKFPNGVFWFDCTASPSFELQKAALLTTLGRPSGESLHIALKNIPVLLILDGVVDSVQVQPFLNAVSQTTSRVLITCIQKNIATRIQVEALEFAFLKHDESRELLLSLAHHNSNGTIPEIESYIERILDECGGSPIAVKVAGSYINGNPTLWKGLVDYLEDGDFTALTEKFGGDSNYNLYRITQKSVERLYELTQILFSDLAIFPKDRAILVHDLIVLWKREGFSEADIRSFVSQLVDASLASYGKVEETLVLHGLQWDYIRAIAKDLPAMHARIVESYRKECNNKWPEAPDDGYFFENLAYHLSEAGNVTDLYLLASTMEWILLKVDKRLSISLLEDYSIVLEQNLSDASRLAFATVYSHLRQIFGVLGFDIDLDEFLAQFIANFNFLLGGRELDKETDNILNTLLDRAKRFNGPNPWYFSLPLIDKVFKWHTPSREPIIHWLNNGLTIGASATSIYIATDEDNALIPMPVPNFEADPITGIAYTVHMLHVSTKSGKHFEIDVTPDAEIAFKRYWKRDWGNPVIGMGAMRDEATLVMWLQSGKVLKLNYGSSEESTMASLGMGFTIERGALSANGEYLVLAGSGIVGALNVITGEWTVAPDSLRTYIQDKSLTAFSVSDKGNRVCISLEADLPDNEDLSKLGLGYTRLAEAVLWNINDGTFISFDKHPISKLSSVYFFEYSQEEYVAIAENDDRKRYIAIFSFEPLNIAGVFSHDEGEITCIVMVGESLFASSMNGYVTHYLLSAKLLKK